MCVVSSLKDRFHFMIIKKNDFIESQKHRATYRKLIHPIISYVHLVSNHILLTFLVGIQPLHITAVLSIHKYASFWHAYIIESYCFGLRVVLGCVVI